MKDAEFNEIITDFDGFMRRHGYYTLKEIAEHDRTTPDAIRMRIKRGLVKGSVKINGKHYIPFDSRGR
ncbi:MAG: hypothetical protein J6I76_00150 [Oribacterium sp.]|nr:hypothetical protein [Oribacterium sp.]